MVLFQTTKIHAVEEGNMGQNKIKIAIIGGGVSGTAAALELDQRFEVHIFERNERLLKKLLMTGNGKSNIFTTRLNASLYNDQKFMENHDKKMQPVLLNFFNKNNIAIKIDDYGRVYPFSNSARALANILTSNFGKNVKTHLNFNVESISKVNGKYVINSSDINVFDYVILSAGSSAGLSKTPLDNNNANLLSSLDLKSSKLIPTVSSISIEENLRLIENERLDAKVSLYKGDNLITSDSGEVLFKRTALSGIVSFVVSSYLAWENSDNSKYKISLDLLEDQRTIDYISSRKDGENLIDGIFSQPVAAYLKSRLNNDYSLKNTLKLLKNLTFNVASVQLSENAQVVHGGILTSQINPQSFNLLTDPNIYISGEVLNVDGICGGFNLAFAFYSGVTIAKDITDK